MDRRAFAPLLLTLLMALSLAPVGAAQSAEPAAVGLRLGTQLGDGGEFVEGDRVNWLLSLDGAAHVYLFYRDAEGGVWQLLPNARLPDHFFGAGLFQPLPGDGEALRFVIRPPFGEEAVFAFASERGDLSFPRTRAGGELLRLAIDIDGIDQQIRAASREIFDAAVLKLSTRAAGTR